VTASIPIPFAIGEELWWVGRGWREITETCPECAGTLVLTLIKGNGEQQSLDCNYCASGYEPPRGWVKRIVYERKPQAVKPTAVAMGRDPGQFRYTWFDETIDASDLYRDRDACAARCDEMNAEHAKEQARLVVANRESKRRNLAFSSHYWSRMVKDLERDLAAARARLVVCKKPVPPEPIQTEEIL
jgi:hypothetical protein